MGWNYSGNPAASDKDAVRFLIQDTQANRPLLQDEEIAWLLTQEANGFTAAAMCCDILVARGGAVSSKHVGPLSLTYDPKFYLELAATLRSRGLAYQVPYIGGISIADKQINDTNPDAVSPRFFRGMFDNVRATQPSPGESSDRSGYNNPQAY